MELSACACWSPTALSGASPEIVAYCPVGLITVHPCPLLASRLIIIDG